MDYFGEDLLTGKTGQFLIILAFVSSLVAVFSYFKQTRSRDESEKRYWKTLGRAAFITDALSIFFVFGLLFYLFYNHRYEYFYIYKNSSNSLEFKYIFSAIWSASEGSFLLWTLWHSVIGLVLIRTAGKWEGPVMTVLSFAQLCLATMLLGLYFFEHKIGSSPFALFRNQMPDLPLFTIPDYLSRLQDGNDLSPLLQNYWMVIHPPVLFLGFALTVVPFAYSVAGLWTKQFGETVKASMPWALMAGGVLGLGIMMGGAWAYESLSFGGYWAWDPVENASLVPWLTLVAGIHTLLIYKHTGRSLRTTHLFFVITYFLIIYSTFLTRSGILGDTSVHSFADLGMNTQLYLFLLAFMWVPVFAVLKGTERFLSMAAFLVLLAATYFYPVFTLLSFAGAFGLLLYGLKQIPAITQEEATSSREFWMFIGAILLLLTAVFVIGATSLPVFNKIFNKSFTMGEDPIFAYNRIIIFIAFIIGMLTAVTQYLRYKATPKNIWLKKIALPSVISLVIALLVLLFGDIRYLEHGAGYLAAIWLALASSIYAVVANGAYIWVGMKGKLSLSGGSVTHFGFGLMLVGMLISSSKKEILSYNTSGIPVDLGKDSKENAGENLTLIKGMRMDMGKYWVTYAKDSVHPKKQQWYYMINFESKDSSEKFRLMPDAFVNYKGNGGLMANPSAKRKWNYDIFTYITSVTDKEKNTDTASFTPHPMKPGDSVFYSKGFIVLNSIRKSTRDLPEELFGKEGSLYEADITVYSSRGNTYASSPKLAYAKGYPLPLADTVISEGLVVKINKADEQEIELGVKESDTVLDFVTLKAYKFPFINLLWLGTLVMVIGFIISMVRRARLQKAETAAEFNLSGQRKT